MAPKTKFKNDMELITAALEEWKHIKWGFAIYRCTYENDADWAKLIDILTTRVRETVEAYNEPYLFDKFNCIIFDDRALFDQASKGTVRENYRTWLWSEDAAQDQQRGRPAAKHIFPRYKFCIHVDQEALESVLRKAPRPPDPDDQRIAFVNLIDLSWTSDGKHGLIYAEKSLEQYEMEQLQIGEEDEIQPEDETEPEGKEASENSPRHEAKTYPEIDGSVLYDVGWGKLWASSIASCYSMLLGGSDTWRLIYLRPPRITERDPITIRRNTSFVFAIPEIV